MRDGRGEGQGRRGRKRARRSGGGEEGERLGQHCTGAPSSKRGKRDSKPKQAKTVSICMYMFSYTLQCSCWSAVARGPARALALAGSKWLGPAWALQAAKYLS